MSSGNIFSSVGTWGEGWDPKRYRGGKSVSHTPILWPNASVVILHKMSLPTFQDGGGMRQSSFSSADSKESNICHLALVTNTARTDCLGFTSCPAQVGFSFFPLHQFGVCRDASLSRCSPHTHTHKHTHTHRSFMSCTVECACVCVWSLGKT